MPKFQSRRVAWIPANKRAEVNAALFTRNPMYGPDMFSIPIGPAAGPAITHYGCDTASNPEVIADLQAVIPGGGALHDRPMAQALTQGGLRIKR